jgi:S-DNA-T family DNA segregation ATPase FtsK/SpoIIIE
MKKCMGKITKDSNFVKSMIGLVLCLFAIFGALNRGYVSSFITWIVSFLFGWLFYLFYLVVFLIGLQLIFKKKGIKIYSKLVIPGIILIFIGLLVLVTNNITGSSHTSMLNFSNFVEKFSESVQGFPKIKYDKISGGFFGFLFTATVNSFGKFALTNGIAILLLIVGLVLCFIKFVLAIIKKRKVHKAKQSVNDETRFVEANDQTTFTKSQILNSNTRATTVITPDDEIAKENTQSIAIQNPNGGVGVGLTSINRTPTGLRKARFDSENYYETESETTSLNEEPVISKPVEQASTISTENQKVDEVPLAKPAVFKHEEQPYKTKEQVNSLASGTNKTQNVNVASAKQISKAHKNYIYPPLKLLVDRESNMSSPANIQVCETRKNILNETFEEFGINGKVVSYTIGPSVTRFDIEMARGESSRVIEKYLNDIASKLNGTQCRFVPIVEGRTTSGLEIANQKASLVNFKDCLRNLNRDAGSEYLIPFGKDINGRYIVADLKDFPHMLVCGTTGSGKSVFMHTLLMTLIMRNNLDTLKLVIIDPKRVEFNKYKNIPFLLCNPITEADEACLVLNELCNVMEERYDLFDDAGVENLKQYNKYLQDHGKQIMPRIVVMIDEYANLVDTNRQISLPVVSIAQKARAAGIHLIIATQRPSVNVITGVIKSNIPTRVALLCSSTSDSTVILSQGGAEKLLGNGDMLVMSPLISKQGLTRVQGSLVDNLEIKNVCDFLRQNYEPEFDERFVDLKVKSQLDTSEMHEVSYDKAASDEEKYKQIREDIMATREYCSLSYIQRTYSVGFNRAGKIIMRLTSDGVISSVDEGNKGRKVLLHSIGKEERKGSIEQTSFDPSKK